VKIIFAAMRRVMRARMKERVGEMRGRGIFAGRWQLCCK